MNGIQVKNLVKTYITQSTDIILNGAKRPSTTRTVLHGVSVDFPAGKLTAILGRSGCGKSTLLRLIDGTKDAPDSGEIVMPEGWRCALLSPDPYVITWTSVERNVAMAAGAGRTPEERLELAKKLVKLVRLEDYADMSSSSACSSPRSTSSRVASCKRSCWTFRRSCKRPFCS